MKEDLFVFVLMPFSKSFDDVYKVGIKAACKELNVYCGRVNEQIFSGNILERVYNRRGSISDLKDELTKRLDWFIKNPEQEKLPNVPSFEYHFQGEKIEERKKIFVPYHFLYDYDDSYVYPLLYGSVTFKFLSQSIYPDIHDFTLKIYNEVEVKEIPFQLDFY